MKTQMKHVIAAAAAAFVCLTGGMSALGNQEAKAQAQKIEDQVASFVSELEAKINARDIDAVRSMFLPQATNCVPRLPEDHGDSLRLEVVRVNAGTNLSADVWPVRAPMV